MRSRTLVLIGLLLTLFIVTACGHAGHVRTRVTIGVGFFYDNLAVHGDWLWLDAHGWVWTPWDVGVSWRPYTQGHWVYTIDGWTWVSAWPWGWAPFHYGRWLRNADHGWLWIPGTEWAPAWVAWRYSPGTVGWAPLPPHARWHPTGGLQWDGAAGLDVYAWSFVHDRDFLHLRLDQRLTYGDHDRSLLERTREVTRYEPGPHGAIVRSIPLADIERVNGPVPRLRVEDLQRPPQVDRDRTQRDGVWMYRPEVKKAPPGTRPPKGKKRSGRGQG